MFGLGIGNGYTTKSIDCASVVCPLFAVPSIKMIEEENELSSFYHVQALSSSISCLLSPTLKKRKIVCYDQWNIKSGLALLALQLCYANQLRMHHLFKKFILNSLEIILINYSQYYQFYLQFLHIINFPINIWTCSWMINVLIRKSFSIIIVT